MPLKAIECPQKCWSFFRHAPQKGTKSAMGQSATKWYVRVKSGSPPITDIRLAFPKLAPRGRKRHVAAVLPRPTVWRTSKPPNCG
jgi:hypothetical protein